jgi:membrane-associated phospholipid phosphatase
MSQSQIVDLLASHILLWSLGMCLLVVSSVWLASLLFSSIWQRYRDWFEGHFTRIGYIRSYIISGILVTLAFAWAFGECLELAFEKNSETSFDNLLATALHEQAGGLTVKLFGCITLLGGTLAAIVLGVSVGIWLFRRKEYSLLTMWCCGLVGNAALIYFLKLGFQRQRPVFDNPFVTEPYYSFPSGHSMTSIVLYGLLAYLAFHLAPSYANWTTATVLIVIGTLVGLSRMVLGAHYFSDVLGGWVLGFEWVAMSVVGTQIYLSWRGSKTPPDNDRNQLVGRSEAF